MTIELGLVLLAVAAALVTLGGGLYEYLVIDPAWPERPEIIQPQRGGVSRKRFWIPVHVAFELLLIVSLVLWWGVPGVRLPLLLALVSHAVMRLWSAVDFIPKALAFERADPGSVEPGAARRWTRRSVLRLPLDLVTCGAMVVALLAAG